MMKRILLSLVALGSIASLNAAAISYQIAVDTSSISNSTAGFIEFQFNQANAETSLNATASVSGFTSTGFTFDSMSNFSLGSVTGSLSSPPLVFDNTGGGTNLYDIGVSNFGTGFSFILTLDGPALNTSATDGSQFFVFLLGTDYGILAGPEGGVAGVTINGDTTITPSAVANLSTIESYSPPSAVPEPSGFLLLGSGVIMLVFCRFLRFRRSA